MNSLKPENITFVPKNQTKHCLLACSTSLIMLVIGMLLMAIIFYTINS